MHELVRASASALTAAAVVCLLFLPSALTSAMPNAGTTLAAPVAVMAAVTLLSNAVRRARVLQSCSPRGVVAALPALTSPSDR
jgi:hypothetical protein